MGYKAEKKKQETGCSAAMHIEANVEVQKIVGWRVCLYSLMTKRTFMRKKLWNNYEKSYDKHSLSCVSEV